MARGGFSTASFLCSDSDRVLVLRHGASLLHLLWSCDSSFTDHRAVVDQYYVHLVCSLIRLFQQIKGISQVEGKLRECYTLLLFIDRCHWYQLV